MQLGAKQPLAFLRFINAKLRDSRFIPWWMVGFLLLAGWALRLYRLGVQSLWYDEVVSAILARQSLLQLTAHTAGDIHPPAYYYLLHFWIRLVGDSEYALALPSAFFSLLLIPLLCRLGRRLVGWRATAWGIALLTFSPFNLWYAQEVRMYTMGAALGLAALYGASRMMESPDPDKQGRYYVPSGPWLVYVLASTVGLYTLYYFAFLLLFLNLFFLGWLLLRRRPPMSAPATPSSLLFSPLPGWLLAQLAVLILYLPWLPTALRQALNPPVPPWRSFVPIWQIVLESWTALSLGQSVEVWLIWPLLLVGIALYVLGLASFARPRQMPEGSEWPVFGFWSMGLLLAGYTFAPLIFILLASQRTPLYHVRYLFTFSPLFYLVLGCGLCWIAHGDRRWSWPAGWAVLFVFLAGCAYSTYNFHFNPLYSSDDWRGAVIFVADHWRPGDAVLVNAGYTYPAFLYYYPGEVSWRGRLTDYRGDEQAGEGPVVVQTGSIGGGASLGWSSPESDFYATTGEETAAALGRLLDNHPRLWVLRAYDTVVDPDGFIRDWLTTHTVTLEDQVFSGESNVRAQGYMSLRAPGAPTRAGGTVFGEALALRGYDEPTATPRPGGTLDLVLYWEMLAPVERDYAVSLKLFDRSQNFVWAQRDELPLGALFRTSQWPTNQLINHPLRLTIPSGTPPGDYDLRLEVYNPYTKVPLPISDDSGSGTFADLGKVTVLSPAWQLSPPPLQHEMAVDFSSRLALLGYNLPDGGFKPGEEFTIELFWRGHTTPKDDYIVTLRMVDSADRVVAAQESQPVFGRYPTTDWTPDEIVRDPHQLTVPAVATSGAYNLILSVYRADSGERLPISHWIPLLGGKDSVTLQAVEVQGRPVQMTPPQSVQYPRVVRLGENVELLGYGLDSTQVAPGDKLKLTLYWHARGAVGRNFKVFNHLVGQDGTIWGQRDNVPGDGALPTAGWQPGEYLTDTYEIEVKPDAPPGSYSLLVGMYDEGSGTRLPTFDAKDEPLGDHVVLSKIEVVKKP